MVIGRIFYFTFIPEIYIGVTLYFIFVSPVKSPPVLDRKPAVPF